MANKPWLTIEAVDETPWIRVIKVTFEPETLAQALLAKILNQPEEWMK